MIVFLLLIVFTYVISRSSSLVTDHVYGISSLNKRYYSKMKNINLYNTHSPKEKQHQQHDMGLYSTASSYLDDAMFRGAGDRKCLVGFTNDAWNIGGGKYKSFLAVNKMIKRISKSNVPCVDLPMWEIAQGPHYDDLQRLFETFWISDMTSTDQLLLQFDLTIIPDSTIAKYMVEAFYEKEAKVEKKKQYYNKLQKQPWGVIDAFPPKERYDFERIKNLSKQRIRTFPPIACIGDESYKRLKNHGQVEYYATGVEDFALYLPGAMVPSKRVLLLRYKNRFDTLVQSLLLKGVHVTSAYPVTWLRRDWSPQEERLSKEVDVVYLHEIHAVNEWRDRLASVRDRLAVTACHDEEVARAAKAAGFKDVFYAKKSDSDGLTKCILQAIDYAKRGNR